MVEREVSDEQLSNAKYRFPYQTPTSKEEFYYRSIFEEHFPSDAAATTVPSVPSVACSSRDSVNMSSALFRSRNSIPDRLAARRSRVTHLSSQAVPRTDC